MELLLCVIMRRYMHVLLLQAAYVQKRLGTPAMRLVT
jgi:hypothetical protein